MSILLFVYFGLKMLWDARQMYVNGEGTGASEELQEVEEELMEAGLVEHSPGGTTKLDLIENSANAEFGLDDG